MAFQRKAGCHLVQTRSLISTVSPVFVGVPDTGPPSVILSDFLAQSIHLSFIWTIPCPVWNKQCLNLSLAHNINEHLGETGKTWAGICSSIIVPSSFILHFKYPPPSVKYKPKKQPVVLLVQHPPTAVWLCWHITVNKSIGSAKQKKKEKICTSFLKG